MKLNAYGRILEVSRGPDGWEIFILGDGKKRRDHGIVIPAGLSEQEVIGYLEDLLHESATPENSSIQMID